MITFEKASTDKKDEVSLFLKNMEENENGFVGIPKTMSEEEFLQKCVKDMDTENLPEGRVPQTVFWAKKDNKVVGMLKVRHYLNKVTLVGGGHFAYYVAKEYRGQRYSKQMIKFAVDWLRKHGEKDILVTIYPENIISQKAAMACGFNHEDTIRDNTGNQLMRYWNKI